MEIVTVGQTLQDNTNIYELSKDGKHIFFGTARSISRYLHSRASSIAAAIKHNRALHGYDITPIGKFEYYFEKEGVTGSKRMLRKEFGLSQSTKFYKTIGGFVNGESVTEISIETFNKRQEEERKSRALYLQSLVPKTKYKGENKAYVDSLFKSCFKGW